MEKLASKENASFNYGEKSNLFSYSKIHLNNNLVVILSNELNGYSWFSSPKLFLLKNISEQPLNLNIDFVKNFSRISTGMKFSPQIPLDMLVHFDGPNIKLNFKSRAISELPE